MSEISIEQNPPLWLTRVLLAGAEGQKVHAFHAETGRWTELAPALDADHELRAGTTVGLVEQRDANEVRAYNALTGATDTLPIPAELVRVEVSGNIALVVHLAAAHAFPAGAGKDSWSAAPAIGGIVQPENVRVGATAAVVTEGVTDEQGKEWRRLHGFSALRGAWAEPLTVEPGEGDVFEAAGNVAIALVRGRAHAFSAITNAWTTLSASPVGPSARLDTNLAMVRERDWVAVHAFSALLGAWDSQPLPANPPATPTWAVSGNTGMVEVPTAASDPPTEGTGPGILFLYSAIRNDWLSTQLQAGDRYALEAAPSM